MTSTAAVGDEANFVIDAVTPHNIQLAARYKKSFAYTTFRLRLPASLNSLIDNLKKDEAELAATYSEKAKEDIAKIICRLTKLKDDICQNKPLSLFDGNQPPDTKLWNTFICGLPENESTFFSACWLYAECYMYRRISAIFHKSPCLQKYDYFGKQKQNAAVISKEAMEAVAIATRNLEKNVETFIKLTKLNLWGNRMDLSITSGKQVKPTGEAFEQIASLDTNLLIDETMDVWSCICSDVVPSKPFIIDIVCDNAGYELYTDLILAEYIIDKGLAGKVRFHVKAIPWFISDVMEHDYHWTLKFLREHSSAILSELGKKLTKYLDDGKFELIPLEYFWTSPYEYFRMREINCVLYEQLAQAQLVIFKGDLNYRKLLGDFNWEYTEAFTKCIRGFLPTNICTLRTVKADLICGLRPGQAEELFKKDSEWMLTGEYGLIQCAKKTK